MKEKYGNSFGGSEEGMILATYTPWIRVDEFYPGGAMVKVGQTMGTYTPKKGDKIPLGTPIYMTGLGGKPYSTISTGEGQSVKAVFAGLTYEDAYVGEEGCSLTIVTRGTIHKENVEVTEVAKEGASFPGITIV